MPNDEGQAVSGGTVGANGESGRKMRRSFAVVTVAATTGSVPRAAGSKMFVYADGRTSGTIGGGKFESLAVADAITAIGQKKPILKKYPLHEGETDSFGAICGGEVTLFIEPQKTAEALYLIGGGHCSRAIAKLASECGLFVTVVEDRPEQMAELPLVVDRVSDSSPADFIAGRVWQNDEALVIVSRNHEIDALRAGGISEEQLSHVYAPLGLDIGSDSPAEIAVSTVAEVLAVLRGRSAKHMRGGE
jgi:xanthine dehydrogenase accessory factor